MKFKTRYGIVNVADYDINSLYPHNPPIHLGFPKYELLETTETDSDTWYNVRVFSRRIETWISEQDADLWDEAASSNYRGDSTNYWIHGKLYSFMLLKWPSE